MSTKGVLMQLDKKVKDEIISKLKKEGAKSIAFFGSYVRNDASPESDLDILVEFSDDKTLFDLARIERELSKKTKIEIDLVTENALSPLFKEKVEREKEVLV